MRRHPRKASRARDREGAGVSLFPFLAVLISTMGALILLLVVFARQARLQAAQATEAQSVEIAQQEEDLKRARGMAAWEKNELKVSREKTEAQLAEARLALGHIEDHSRRLAEEYARLEAAWDELDRYETEGDKEQEQKRAELARVKAELDLARRKLDQAREDLQLRKRSYAIIPYEGANGTRRRPIYIECRSDSVVLQPEGIVLTAEDFVGPSGPGNPLEVALRAMREYIQHTETGQGGEQAAEPYPLLLVRPSGVEAYAAARVAMASWGSGFGYELIEDDWQIEFGSPDPEMARHVGEALEASRRRLALLARAAPSHYGGGQTPTYSVRPYRGGVMRTDGGGRGPGDADQAAAGRGWGKRSASSAKSSSNRTSDRADGNGGSPGSQTGTQRSYGNDSPVSEADGPILPDGRSGQSPGDNPLRGVEQGQGSSIDRPRGDRSDASEAGGRAPRPGEWIPHSDANGSNASIDASQQSESCPLAEARGKNWALPDAANGSFGITRPIRVDCHPDRLEVVSASGQARGQVVALGDRTEDTVDTFISAVWDHMESWGIAGRGMYWQPVLNVRVAAGAEARFADLKTLLDRSGLRVKRIEGD